MNVYGVQFNIVWEDKPANFATVRHLLADARPEPGSLIVLPEMFATGFSMNASANAEGPDGETFQFLAETAREYRCFVLGGVPTRNVPLSFHNESLLFDANGALIARYAKMYPFTLGGEKDNYTAGDSPIIVGVAGFCLAPFICYDLRFPEAFRLAAAQGAEVYTVIASWPEMRIGHWVTLLQARAIENQAYVIGVNRCGTDPFFRHTGRSLIIGPDGAILADAGESEGVISATFDRGTVEAYRRKLPFLNDMREGVISDSRR
jgi:omega-amidase